MTTQARYIAAIDIGTNSFHLLIAKIKGMSFEIIHRERKVLRLRDKDHSDRFTIRNEKINEATELLKEFSAKSKIYNAEIHAVATSALRDADNKETVCKKIADAAEIDIKILSGDEEAVLSFYAAVYGKEISNKKVLVFDLGGGSTEFIIGQSGEIIYKTSVQLGAVRFTQQYFPDFYISSDGIENFRQNVRAVLLSVQKEILNHGFDYCVGIGGTITAVSWLIEKNVFGREHNFRILHDYRITKDDFEQVKQIVLSKKSLEERKLIHGLELKRADIIPAGVLIVNELFELFQITEIVASGNSIKEGIILNLLEAGRQSPGKP